MSQQSKDNIHIVFLVDNCCSLSECLADTLVQLYVTFPNFSLTDQFEKQEGDEEQVKVSFVSYQDGHSLIRCRWDVNNWEEELKEVLAEQKKNDQALEQKLEEEKQVQENVVAVERTDSKNLDEVGQTDIKKNIIKSKSKELSSAANISDQAKQDEDLCLINLGSADGVLENAAVEMAADGCADNQMNPPKEREKQQESIEIISPSESQQQMQQEATNIVQKQPRQDQNNSSVADVKTQGSRAQKSAFNEIYRKCSQGNRNTVVFHYTDAPPHTFSTSYYQGGSNVSYGAILEKDRLRGRKPGFDWIQICRDYAEANIQVFTFLPSEAAEKLHINMFHMSLGHVFSLPYVTSQSVAVATMPVLLKLINELKIDNYNNSELQQFKNKQICFPKLFNIYNQINNERELNKFNLNPHKKSIFDIHINPLVKNNFNQCRVIMFYLIISSDEKLYFENEIIRLIKQQSIPLILLNYNLHNLFFDIYHKKIVPGIFFRRRGKTTRMFLTGTRIGLQKF
eukprot:TRINITY_DN2307_c0_g1_i3.p1 TRINITY_DN2307_c0_g1~~TRINITY_DN2307_c0_g1_i3.p1  ORF type:complete len:512 (-),score=54.16 TRINITY_DN2307_c0_g1_i3:2723-4258(-)